MVAESRIISASCAAALAAVPAMPQAMPSFSLVHGVLHVDTAAVQSSGLSFSMSFLISSGPLPMREPNAWHSGSDTEVEKKQTLL